MRHAFALSLLLASPLTLAVNIDFSRSGMQVLSKDTIQLRNVKVDGRHFYGVFRWEGDKLELVAAGEDKLPYLAVTQKSYVAAEGVGTNLRQACMQEFAPHSRVADFRDLEAATSDNNALESFLGMLAEGKGRYFISYGKLLYQNGRRPYFITAENVDPNQADLVTRLRGVLGLYAAKVPVEGKVVCINVAPDSNPFFEP